MNELLSVFDATQIDPSQGASSLPVGRHVVVLVGAEVRANKNEDGGLVAFTARITQGPQAGLQGGFILNLYHQSQTTREIAERQMSALCHVVGVFNVKQLNALFNIEFVIDVTPQADNPKYVNVKFLHLDGSEPGRGKAPQQQQPQQQNQAFNQPQNNNQGGFNQPLQQEQQPQQGSWNNQAAGGWNGGGNQQPQQQQNQGAGWNANANQGGGDSKPAWAR